MNGMNLTPVAPLARSLGRASDEARARALRNMVSQASRERFEGELAEADGNLIHQIRKVFSHLTGLLQPYVQGTVAQLSAIRSNERLPDGVRAAATTALGDARALPDQRGELVADITRHVERVFVAVGTHYENGVANGRASESAGEGVDELDSLKKALGSALHDIPEVRALIEKIDVAIVNLDPPKHRSATPGM